MPLWMFIRCVKMHSDSGRQPSGHGPVLGRKPFGTGPQRKNAIV